MKNGLVIENGGKEWYLNGKRHRTDGPAIERANGGKYWYLNDKLHRTDGPAIEWADGSSAWYIDGKELSKSQIDEMKDIYPEYFL